MSRRSKQSIDAGMALLMAAIAAVAVVASWVVSLFSLVLLSSPFYWFLLLIATLLYLVVRIAQPPPNMSATDFFSTAELKSLISAQAEQRWLFEQKVQLHGEAQRQDIWTRRSEPTRFDERKMHARALNEKLDRFDRQYEALGSRTYEIGAPVLGRLHAWKRKVKVWNRRAALLTGTQWALLCYIATAVIVAACQPNSVHQISSSLGGSLLFKSTAFEFFYGPLVIAFPVSVVVGGVGIFLGRRRLDNQFTGEDAFYEQWTKNRLPPSQEYVDFLGSAESGEWDNNHESRETEDRDNSQSEGNSNDERSCYEILGVTPAATVVEIKRAYGECIKQYHPDHVARMGPRVIEVAERETKLINAARAEALGRCARQT